MYTLRIFLDSQSGPQVAETNYFSLPVAGAWEGGEESGEGRVAFFEILEDGAVIASGTVSGSGKGGDLQVDNDTYAATTGFNVVKMPI